MNPLSPLPTGDIDGVLRAFFKAQTPSPWPKAPAVVARTTKGRPMLRSRLALAAAAALLALGLSSLAGAFHGRAVSTEQRIRIESASASAENDPLHHAIQPRVKGTTAP